mgnify:CR=1 FL=1|jgi:hypothetical protein
MTQYFRTHVIAVAISWRKVVEDIDPSREAIVERTVKFFVDHLQE